MFTGGIDVLVEKLRDAADYIKNNKKAAVIVSIAFLLAVFTIALLQNLPPKTAPQISQPPVVPLLNELLIPAEPSIEQKYELFRKTPVWDEELNRWFTEPDGAVFEELRRANSSLVNEILGAVP